MFQGPGEKVFTTVDAETKTVFTVKTRKVGVLNPMDMQYVQFHNIMIRKIMEHLDLVIVNRNYYDNKASIPPLFFFLKIIT